MVKLGPGHAHAAYAFCTRHPARCTYIAGWIREGGLLSDPRVPKAWLLGCVQPRDHIEGLVYISETGIVIPVIERGPPVEALMGIARKNPNLVRVLVGERSLVEHLWTRLERLGMVARIIRDQLGFIVTPERFRGVRDLALQGGSVEHLPQIVRASAEMAKEEAQDDPYGRNPELFEQRIKERLDRGRDFIHLQDGRLAFKSNVSAISPLGGQIEGVYTVPEHRRQGLGRRGTSTITRWVLGRAERAFLLVNQDNESAKRLYVALGYEQVLLSQTIFIA